jgi:energy-coupling factor transporter ATP-binding protein EcfA2
MTATAAVDAAGLVKTFGRLRAVDGIDLHVRQGEIFGLLGPNGAGKTTLLRMLATLLPAGLVLDVQVVDRDGIPAGEFAVYWERGVRTPLERSAVVVLDGQWNVIAIRRELRPFRLTRVFWKAAAVLELPSGMVESCSTSVGDALEFSRADGAGI